MICTRARVPLSGYGQRLTLAKLAISTQSRPRAASYGLSGHGYQRPMQLMIVYLIRRSAKPMTHAARTSSQMRALMYAWFKHIRQPEPARQFVVHDTNSWAT